MGRMLCIEGWLKRRILRELDVLLCERNYKLGLEKSLRPLVCKVEHKKTMQIAITNQYAPHSWGLSDQLCHLAVSGHHSKLALLVAAPKRHNPQS